MSTTWPTLLADQRYEQTAIGRLEGACSRPDGPHRRIGCDNPYKADAIRGFALTRGQREDEMAFLRALTDEMLLSDPRFADPFLNP